MLRKSPTASSYRPPLHSADRSAAQITSSGLQGPGATHSALHVSLKSLKHLIEVVDHYRQLHNVPKMCGSPCLVDCNGAGSYLQPNASRAFMWSNSSSASANMPARPYVFTSAVNVKRSGRSSSRSISSKSDVAACGWCSRPMKPMRLL